MANTVEVFPEMKGTTEIVKNQNLQATPVKDARRDEIEVSWAEEGPHRLVRPSFFSLSDRAVLNTFIGKKTKITIEEIIK